MQFNALAAFLLTATILTMAPGLDTANVLRSAANEGPRAGSLTALGIAMGCLCWGAAAAFGLGAIMHARPLIFEALRCAGAVYLVYLGLRLIFRPRRVIGDEACVDVAKVSALPTIRRGFLTNILNPKVGLFYLTLLPQFVPKGGGSGDAFALACMQVGIALVWFVSLAALTNYIRLWLRIPKVARMLDQGTGGFFVLLALEIGFSAAMNA
jgi:threonine/homoserine/homoserine lactone efflux protein